MVEKIDRDSAQLARALGAAQKSRLIGSALEALVRLDLPPGPLLAYESLHPGELEELLILSRLEIREAPGLRVEVLKSPHQKCARCWRHRPDVGGFSEHPELCSRCHEAVVA